jgi:hypothetical protein
MPRLRFTATGDLPRFLLKKAHVAEVAYGEGKTTKVVPTKFAEDGDYVDLDAFEADWCLAMYPDNFKSVKTRSKESIKETEL